MSDRLEEIKRWHRLTSHLDPDKGWLIAEVERLRELVSQLPGYTG